MIKSWISLSEKACIIWTAQLTFCLSLARSVTHSWDQLTASLNLNWVWQLNVWLWPDWTVVWRYWVMVCLWKAVISWTQRCSELKKSWIWQVRVKVESSAEAKKAWQPEEEEVSLTVKLVWTVVNEKLTADCWCVDKWGGNQLLNDN